MTIYGYEVIKCPFGGLSQYRKITKNQEVDIKMSELNEGLSINKYQVGVVEITNDWQSLYIVIDPTDIDGDILLSSKGIGGDGVHFNKAMLPLLIEGLSSLVGDKND